MFIDASALCAVTLNEADAASMLRRIELTDRRWTSATATYGKRSSRRHARRETRAPVAETHAMILGFCRDMGIDVLPIPPEAAALAIDAYAQGNRVTPFFVRRGRQHINFVILAAGGTHAEAKDTTNSVQEEVFPAPILSV